MKRTLVEKGAVAVMFVLVLVVFSFAERDTQKLMQLHSTTAEKLILKPDLTASTVEPKALPSKLTRK
jgi:hypothetical protein